MNTVARDPLSIKPDPSKAAHACRMLIRAHMEDGDHVDCQDVQDALTVALAAFQLDETYIESEGGQWL